MRQVASIFGKLVLLLLILAPVSSCHSQAGPSGQSRRGESVDLTIIGFNYTNKNINDFSVDGVGGGNVYVSSPTGGGGGSVCCAAHVIGAPAWKSEVRWQVDGCKFNTRFDKAGNKFDDIHRYYKTETVQIAERIPPNPAYLEVHFYPDGHVELAITEAVSPPRLKLDASRAQTSSYKQCPNDKAPG